VLAEFKKTHADKAQIIIRGDKDMEYRKLEAVLVEIAAAGITDTAYETTNKVETPPSDAAAQ
jgi:biopolymer transport protein ExbD